MDRGMYSNRNGHWNSLEPTVSRGCCPLPHRSTKSHPGIPEHLSDEAKDFLLKCLQKEPNMRADASKLLQHPFVTGRHEASAPAFQTPLKEESSEMHLQSHTKKLETFLMSSDYGSVDMCNLGSLSSSINPKKLFTNNSDDDDDMCQVDTDGFSTIMTQVKLNPVLIDEKLTESSNPKDGFYGDSRCKFDETPVPVPAGVELEMDQRPQRDHNLSYACGTSPSEDDDELTESKIRAFLGEKVLELKKMQTPLYEEFFNSLNGVGSPSFTESLHETPPNYLKLPPKSKSPGRIPVGTTSSPSTNDAGSPGSNIRHASNVSPDANISPECYDRKSGSFSDIQKKWKEELDQELERKREMRRQAGAGSKTSSPKDRALNRQRERTRFASPTT